MSGSNRPALIDIVTREPYLRPFPEPEFVFADKVDCLARHLNSLVSIDLSILEPAWIGWIHVVCPVETYDDPIGYAGREFHNEYLKENWLAFQLDSNRGPHGSIYYFIARRVEELSRRRADIHASLL
jgi:hypothetical protein